MYTYAYQKYMCIAYWLHSTLYELNTWLHNAKYHTVYYTAPLLFVDTHHIHTDYLYHE
jgi:hypothetical protein